MAARSLILALSLLAPLEAAAQLLRGPEGAAEALARDSAMARLSVPLAATEDGPPPIAALDGAYSLRVWNGGAATPLAAIKALEARLAQAGFETALLCVAAECGGYDFYAALDIAPPPEMALGLHDFVHLTMRKGETALFAATASALDGMLRMQAALVEAATTTIPAPRPDPLELQPLPPDTPPAGRPPLAEALLRTGRAVLEEVAFLPGSTEVAPGSAAALDAAAAALQALPDLEVAVVGHTDNAGDLAVNLRVSKARAQAVMAALQARGVAAARLSAEGAAWLAPRAANRDEAGRALNRRVELVAR